MSWYCILGICCCSRRTTWKSQWMGKFGRMLPSSSSMVGPHWPTPMGSTRTQVGSATPAIAPSDILTASDPVGSMRASCGPRATQVSSCTRLRNRVARGRLSPPFCSNWASWRAFRLAMSYHTTFRRTRPSNDFVSKATLQTNSFLLVTFPTHCYIATVDRNGFLFVWKTLGKRSRSTWMGTLLTECSCVSNIVGHWY